MRIHLQVLLCAVFGMFSSSKLWAHQMNKIPKAELHLHLGGAYPLEYVLSIASKSQEEKLLNYLNLFSSGMDYPECLKVFPVISEIVNTEEKVENGTQALCKALQKDGVIYTEIRTGLKDLGKGYESYLKAVISGASECKKLGTEVKILLSLQRFSSVETARRTVDLAIQYRKHGVVGIDLSGDSTLGNVFQIASEIQRAKKGGFFLTVHLGESVSEVQQFELLQLLRPDRIGHGVHLTEEAKNWILENQVPLEICLTSSVLVKMVENIADHPGFQFSAINHPVTLATDDPLIFRSTLSGEYVRFQKISGFSDRAMISLSLQSFDSAFLSYQEKAILKEKAASLLRSSIFFRKESDLSIQ